jgi:hypothetical protein
MVVFVGAATVAATGISGYLAYSAIAGWDAAALVLTI